ncbi:hypothetical protein GM418_10780 [Maribellus comscasis]|uniref:HEPN domain-containing protein n=1 Tax=Maribellus comscasis TaxID=2681766 RepID=A0A6I6K2I4_9BACT|nr:hypothetical protein [Maribellus comscasis]QGY44124.1 hypothetical protein GM418_10780 [Maribellus comscasis]
MRFNPRDFITIAEEISNGNTEAHYRSLVNRAYYGAFGYIKDQLNIINEGFSVHQEVYNQLLRSPDISKQKAGKKLEQLLKKRNQMDYRYAKNIKPFEIQYTIQTAKSIIKLFDESNTQEES